VPNLVLSSCIPEHKRDQVIAALNRRLDPELAKDVVVTHLRHREFAPGAVVRTTMDHVDKIAQIAAACESCGVICLASPWRARLFVQPMIEFFGIGSEQVGPMLETSSLGEELLRKGSFHNVEFRYTPATVLNLAGEPDPFCSVQSAAKLFVIGIKPDDNRSRLMAEHLRQICGVELFLFEEDGQMTEYLEKLPA
jgi:hypothetical protein